MFEDAKQQISELPKWVQIWMRWLNIVFLLGLKFVGDHVEARWVIAAYLAAFPVGFLAFYCVRDIRITGLPHLLVWVPLLVYLILAAFRDPAFQLTSLYGAWVVLLCLTIAISASFDVIGIGQSLMRNRRRDQLCR